MFGSSVSDNITLDMQVRVSFESVGAVSAVGHQHGSRAFAAACAAQHASAQLCNATGIVLRACCCECRTHTPCYGSDRLGVLDPLCCVRGEYQVGTNE